ncbi:uncharacterized protein LOC124694589 [Lolium rigidum]|uniref:uncharacterized protein LOC124694589 n=1 Tax=Lolium rigidum TaxID=89674 RepID=UPI001F5CFEDA|nr:uncharacterized protein LOC124694589 [Lolium rigidum]
MGCFLGCFGGAKSKERRHRRRKRSPAQSPSARARHHSPSKADLHAEAVSAAAPLLSTLLELRDSADDLCLTVVKKKVTFDSNVTAYEAPPIPEEADPAPAGGDEEASWMLAPDCAKSEAFPLNHRYGNCAGAADDDSDYEDCYDSDDDEYEDEDDEEGEDGIDAIDDDEEHGGGLLGIARGEEEACESLFLLPVTRTTKESAGPLAAAEARAPVLGSVENFTEWQDAKPRTTATATATAAAPKNSDKENTVALGVDKLSDPAKKNDNKPAVSSDYTPSTPSKQEASVDASLSTWLGSAGTPESHSVRSYSPISREDRPILGALTVEDIKISSANSSPSRRSRSPSPSPDDMPILGTVGAYWNCSDNSVTRGGFMKTRSRFGQTDDLAMIICVEFRMMKW